MTQQTLDSKIESLCFQDLGGRKMPLWPYVVAVTGHRVFAKPGEVEGLPGYERETIKETFKRELEQMALQWKKACGSVNAPFILLTGLAAGADQLAAEAALALQELNVKVIAVLPMKKELFRLTIEKEADQDLFDSLLKQVHMMYELPLSVPEDSPEYAKHYALLADVDNPDTKKERDEEREEQYKKLGEFLALHSHVLFAFWDGIDRKDLVGGTSTVLHFKLEGNTENQTQSDEKQTQSDILTYTSVGPVVQFLLPRNDSFNRSVPFPKLENPEEIAVFYWSKRDLWDDEKKCYFFPGREQMTEANRYKTSISLNPDIIGTIERIGDLNRQSLRYSSALRKDEALSIKYLFGKDEEDPDSCCDSIIADFCDEETKVLIHHYTYVDKIAEYFKTWMTWIVFGYLIAVGVFIVFGSLLASFWEIRQNGWGKTTLFSFVHNGQNTWCDMLFSMPWTTIIYWVFILLFLTCFYLAYRWKNLVRFYRFRAVAEALRVQIFWRIAGMNDCVSGYYRSHQLAETEWLRSTSNGLDVLLASPNDMNFQKTQDERLSFVREVWINGQLKYFQQNLAKENQKPDFKIKKTKLKRLGVILWIFGILAFPFVPTWMDSLHIHYHLCTEFLQIFYGLLLILIPIFGLRGFWKTVKQPQSELNRYKQMPFPFDRAILLLNMDRGIKESQTIIRQLGTEAISENASWFLSMGERKMVLPR